MRLRILMAAAAALLLTVGGANTYAGPVFIEINQEVAEEQIQEHAYVIHAIASTIPGIKIKRAKFAYLEILRLEAPELCRSDRCVTYIFRSCAKSVCPYTSAIVGNVFLFSDYIDDVLPKTFSITFKSENQRSLTVSVGETFVSSSVDQ